MNNNIGPGNNKCGPGNSKRSNNTGPGNNKREPGNNKRSRYWFLQRKYKIKTNTAEKLPEIGPTAKKNAYRNHCYKICTGIETRIVKLWPRTCYAVSTKSKKSEPVLKGFT